MDMGRLAQILAARHQGHALIVIVQRDAKMIAGRGIAPRQDDIAEAIGPRGHATQIPLMEEKRPGQGHGLGDIEAKRMRLAGGATLPGMIGRQMAASAGIKRYVALRRGRGLGDIPARTETGIKHAERIELRQGRAIFGEMRGLPPHRPIPIEAEPSEIFQNRRCEVFPDARGIDIFETQEKPASALPRRHPGEKRRIGMAEMQIAGRGWCETGDEASHE